MPRELCLGNGNFLVSFDKNLNIRDLFFPFVGMENHVNGHFCRFGIWVEDDFSWINDSWVKKLGYKEDALVTEVALKNPKLRLELYVEDVVHHFHDILLKKVTIKNTAKKEREVRLFFSHDLHIYETDKGITAYYDPNLDAMIHFKKNRYFLISGLGDNEGLFEFAAGVSEFGDLAGTWMDAEDGRLSKNPVAQGSVDSTISLRATISGQSEKIIYYWIAVGRNLKEVSELNEIVTNNTPEKLIHGATEYYKAWVNKSQINFGDLTERIVKLFKQSLLILRTQIDNRGGIIASSDSDILRFNKDSYSYVWPRDGAFVAMGLDAAGYHHITQRFFKFCKEIITEDGFLFQKYNPDGSWGSTWHPWISSNKKEQLPIQEDETALVIYSLWNHYEQLRDIEFVNPLYEPLICKAADFLVEYRNSETNLPLPSYDLWEEKRGISTFTTSAVYGGLKAASNFAKIFGDTKRAVEYTRAATEIKDALLKHLYDKETGIFLKMVKPIENGEFLKDRTVDSSVYGIFEFGVLPADDLRVEKTMRTVESALWIKTDVGGIARYQNDSYQQVSQEITEVPGNPWPISTLWLAEWHIAKGNLDRGSKLLQWVVDHASNTGVLAEQIHPYNNQPLSVSPLTWSHSTYVLTIIEYLNKLKDLKICEKCGLPIYRKRIQRLW